MATHPRYKRENYNTEDKIPLPVSTLPEILASNGWHTEAITDWAGGDLGKLKFGFVGMMGPEDGMEH